MSDTMTLAMVAEGCLQITAMPCDEETKETYTAYAATVRLADELLGRCEAFIDDFCQCPCHYVLHGKPGHAESCRVGNIIADIRKIRGGGQ